MSDVIVIKVGSSTLVDGTGTLREEILARRVADIAALRSRGLHPVLVSSGAIACGLGTLGFAARPEALPDLQAASAVGQGELFARYIGEFGRHGVVPGQVLLTSADLEHRASYLNARNTLERLVALGAVPVTTEKGHVRLPAEARAMVRPVRVELVFRAPDRVAGLLARALGDG